MNAERDYLGVCVTAGWDFGVLGALRVRRDGESLEIPAAKLRVLLVSLLTNPNRVVPVERLVADLWDTDPPAGAQNTVRNYVMRLRRLLAPELILTRPEGYLLDIAPDCVDLHRFQHLTRQAEKDAADGRLDRAGEALAEAFALWRGEPLLGVPSESLRRNVAPVLTEQWLAAVELRLDVDLGRGRHHTVVPELAELVRRFPFRERFWALRMRALDQAGKRAEALSAYRELSELLAEELGVDPSPSVRELHQRILTNAPSRPEPQPRASVPRQLPAPPSPFTGRRRELDVLSASLDARTDAMTVLTISGTGGIGKTWLALRWAHENLARFPDGQLFVNLRGFDPSGQPISPQAAVRGFLAALGVAPAEIPTEWDAQVGLYRSLVADRRMLLVVDNAVEASQVAPLLPGSSSCTVLVTSRDRLAGLVTAHGAHPVRLDMLSDDEARALLAGRLGSARLDAEPGAVTEFLARCAGLPLALSIVAGRAQTLPESPLSAMAAELRDATTRLGVLEEDSTTGVRVVLSWSSAALSPRHARAFRLLGLAPGPDIGLSAASCLLGLPPDQAGETLRSLQRVSLLHGSATGRFRMHDLVRLHAVEQGRGHTDQIEQEQALRRLVECYTDTAIAGDRLLAPHRPPIDPGRGGLMQPLPDEAAVMAWFDAESACLAATLRFAGEHGWHEVVWRMAWALAVFYSRRGLLHEDLSAWRAALASAGHLNDPGKHTWALLFLGRAHARAGEHTEAIEHLRLAEVMAERGGDRRTQAHVHHALGVTWAHREEHRQALEHAARALHLFRELALPAWEADSLNQVGWSLACLGHYEQARTSCAAALVLTRRHQNPEGEAAALTSLGFIAHRTNRDGQALSYYELALRRCQELDDAYEEANTLERIGQTHLDLGDSAEARAAWARALALYTAQHRGKDVKRMESLLAQPG
ncbi:BTAD domain-containing putative transcriptional regulator [Kutzneria sp. NPDC051319]|uniref:AfsR/SARP family transcriptional regulator n=1 Tax=Kutzneria sp. NPDC051319 TaxID=3155047 RepID=UPI0034246315